MGFRNPVTSLPASSITGGSFSGTYTITGVMQTAAAGNRLIMGGGSALGAPQLLLYSGDATEVNPGGITETPLIPSLDLYSGTSTTLNKPAEIRLRTGDTSGSNWPLVSIANVSDLEVTGHNGVTLTQGGAQYVTAAGPVPYASAAGSVAVVLSAASSGSTAVTFPGGGSRFSVSPIVQATKVSASGSATALVPQITALSSTGMTVSLFAANGVAVTVSPAVHWWAVQMTLASAAG